MKRHVTAARENESTRRGDHARGAGRAEHRRQRDALQRRMPAQRRRVAERHAPFDRAAIQIEATRWPNGGFKSGSPFMNSALVSPTRVNSASTSDARGFALVRSGLADAPDVRLVGGLEVQHAGARVERGTAPVGPADEPGPLHRPLQSSAA